MPRIRLTRSERKAGVDLRDVLGRIGPLVDAPSAPPKKPTRLAVVKQPIRLRTKRTRR